MRAFLNLPVGFKLGTSTLVAVLMLGGVVGTVYVTTKAINEKMAEQARVDASDEQLTEATASSRDVPGQIQAVLAAQRVQDVEAARTAAKAALTASAEMARRAATGISDARAIGAAEHRRDAGRRLFRDRGRAGAAAPCAAHGARRRVLQRASEYDQAFEGANAAIEFDLSGAVQDDVRTALRRLPPGCQRHARLGAALLRDRRRTAGAAHAPRAAQARVPHARGDLGRDRPRPGPRGAGADRAQRRPGKRGRDRRRRDGGRA